jgi:hypothetical protein
MVGKEVGGMNLHPYMVYPRGEEPEKGASLVFAETALAARSLAWKELEWLRGGCEDEYGDVTVRIVEESPRIMAMAQSEEPHVVEFPETYANTFEWWLR